MKKTTEQQVTALFVQAMRTALAIIDEKEEVQAQPTEAGMDLASYLQKSGRGAAARLAKQIGAPTINVSQWRTGERQVPAERCPAIERATGGAVRCETLRPDVEWGALRGSQAAAPTAPVAAPKAKSQKAAPGIYPAKSKYNPWRAYVWNGKKQVYLGQFPTVNKAKAAQKAYLAGQQPKDGTRVANHRAPLEVVKTGRAA